jgi:chaperonin GroEL (HSP60 family)
MNSQQQLFGEGVRRTKGKEARRYNLLAAKLIAEIVSNCLGPPLLSK